MERFMGTWKLTSSDNFDEYMKAVGIGFASRQIANMAKPSLLFSVDDQGFISMKSMTTFKTVEIKFKLDEEFDEITADDRQAKVTYLIHTCAFHLKYYLLTFYIMYYWVALKCCRLKGRASTIVG
uniref:Fatty acid binding protein 11b n=1 Tax=Astyanax mexicanus TaxID=7994 RepID=A0A8B9KSH1_ASTMX